MNKKQRIQDAQLVIAYQSGNQKALSVLVKLWHARFCRASYWIVKDGNAAKDIAQDSWKIIIEKINQLKEPESFKSWALRIVYTKSIDYIKQNTKERLNNACIYEENKNIISNDTIENDASERKRIALLKQIKRLSAHQQKVLQLFYVQEYSLKEISEILEVSVGTIKSRLFHAREKLKTILKETNIEY